MLITLTLQVTQQLTLVLAARCHNVSLHSRSTADNWTKSSHICAYTELNTKSIFSLEIFLRAIHDKVTGAAMYLITIEDANRAVDIAAIFSTYDESKLNF
ncbi:hypothetical protein IFR05_001848 [Cadophora sp. M221]|nr:hypothetical protein IFR05_001848 [Cadophora sp. M221]